MWLRTIIIIARRQRNIKHADTMSEVCLPTLLAIKMIRSSLAAAGRRLFPPPEELFHWQMSRQPGREAFCLNSGFQNAPYRLCSWWILSYCRVSTVASRYYSCKLSSSQFIVSMSLEILERRTHWWPQMLRHVLDICSIIAGGRYLHFWASASIITLEDFDVSTGYGIDIIPPPRHPSLVYMTPRHRRLLIINCRDICSSPPHQYHRQIAAQIRCHSLRDYTSVYWNIRVSISRWLAMLIWHSPSCARDKLFISSAI